MYTPHQSVGDIILQHLILKRENDPAADSLEDKLRRNMSVHMFIHIFIHSFIHTFIHMAIHMFIHMNVDVFRYSNEGMKVCSVIHLNKC